MKPSVIHVLQIALTSLLCVVMAIAGSGCVGDRLCLEEFNGERAYQFVEQQMIFGDRYPGADGHERVGDWILAELEQAGWQEEAQTFTYQGVGLRNLIGRMDPQEGDNGRVILLGAHYDTRPQADRDPLLPHLPVPGANDGGSGVAVLLELANLLPGYDFPFSVWLVFFDAEDSGGIDGWDWIVGSRYFVNHLSIRPEAVIIVDMVGDADLDLYIEKNSDPLLAEQIWEMGQSLGQEAFHNETKYRILDDHTPFLQAGIPAIDIIDIQYTDWHTTDDTLDKVSAESLAQVGKTLFHWLIRLP